MALLIHSRRRLQPEPKFIRNTLDWSDLPGSTTTHRYLKTGRDNITVADIHGATVGTTPRSVMKYLASSRFGDTKMDVSDINGSKFISTRCTNPLSPRYTMRVQSSLGHTSTQNTNAAPRSASSLGHASTLVTLGPVDHSHPGWRPRYDNKPGKDAILRTTDIEGAQPGLSNGLRTQQGGTWMRSSRQRRTWRDTMAVRDIDGNEPVLKKDTMHRRLGRSSDPVDAVYVPLEGIEKAGLLEREILSKPVNVRRALHNAHGVDAEWHVASQADERGLLEKDLRRNFNGIDLEGKGEVSYADFAQTLNRMGLAVPADAAIRVARELDPNSTGKVRWEGFNKTLEAARTRGNISRLIQSAVGGGIDSSPKVETKRSVEQVMVEIKDKLYRKHERFQDAFSRFDHDHNGNISSQEFVNAIQSLNVGATPEMAEQIKDAVDINGDGRIDYFEFVNRLQHQGNEGLVMKAKPEQGGAQGGGGGGKKEAKKTGEDKMPQAPKTPGAAEAEPQVWGERQVGGEGASRKGSKAQSRAGSRLGMSASGRATPNVLLDTRGLLEMERARDEARSEARSVVDLRTPRVD